LDLSLTESQSILRESARKFLMSECPLALVREMETAALGHSPELWHRMAELGWFDLENNRREMGFLELALVVEQMGAVLLPEPFVSTVIGALAVDTFGSKLQKETLLPAIARGESVITLALYESDFKLAEGSVQARAEPVASGWRLFGEKTLVRDLAAADRVICFARTGHGVTAFLLDTHEALILREPRQTMGNDRQWDVTLNGVPVSSADVLGEEGQGWRVATKVLRWGACLTAAFIAGAADRALTLAADYAKQREQFGRPIGKFQAIGHKLADMMVIVEGARLLAYEAAWKLGRGDDSDFEVAAAKAWAGDAFHRTTEEGMRIFASMGYAKDCDMQLYYRRATALRAWLGDSHYQRGKIADMIGI